MRFRHGPARVTTRRRPIERPAAQSPKSHVYHIERSRCVVTHRGALVHRRRKSLLTNAFSLANVRAPRTSRSAVRGGGRPVPDAVSEPVTMTVTVETTRGRRVDVTLTAPAEALTREVVTPLRTAVDLTGPLLPRRHIARPRRSLARQRPPQRLPPAVVRARGRSCPRAARAAGRRGAFRGPRRPGAVAGRSARTPRVHADPRRRRGVAPTCVCLVRAWRHAGGPRPRLDQRARSRRSCGRLLDGRHRAGQPAGSG